MKSELLDLMWYNVGIMRKELFCSFNTIMYAKCCPILTAKFSYWVPKLLKLFHFIWFLVTWERKAREFHLFSISSSWAMRAEEWNKGRKRENCSEDLCVGSIKKLLWLLLLLLVRFMDGCVVVVCGSVLLFLHGYN